MVCEGFQFILMNQANALVRLGVTPDFKVSLFLQPGETVDSAVLMPAGHFRTRCCVNCGDCTCRGVGRPTPPTP